MRVQIDVNKLAPDPNTVESFNKTSFQQKKSLTARRSSKIGGPSIQMRAGRFTAGSTVVLGTPASGIDPYRSDVVAHRLEFLR